MLLAFCGTAGCSGDLESWLDSGEEVPPPTTVLDGPGPAPIDDVLLDQGVPITVDRVVDGDSLEVLVDGEIIELRLEGYNAPELYAGGVDGEPDRLTCNGTAAKEGLAALIEAATEPPILLATDTDRFGRTLGDIATGGQSSVEVLINNGHGLATGSSSENRELMKSAADRQIGIWGDQCPKSSVAFRIADVQNNPDGNDRYNLVDEWVEVVNDDPVAQSLDGWVLRDDTTGHQFELTGTLQPGATLTVRSGGDRSDTSLGGSNPTIYLGESYPVWSNSGETVILTDPTGAFVDWKFIAPG